MQQPQSKFESNDPAEVQHQELLLQAGEPRPSQNKSGLVQNLIVKAAAAGIPVQFTDEGNLRVNMEMPQERLESVYPGITIVDEANMPRDVKLPTLTVHAAGVVPAQVGYVPPVVQGYTPPVFEVAGRYVVESGAIPVYGQEPVLVRKHPTENWSVHWLYQGVMSWVPFTRMPRVSMGMIELHLQDDKLYPREAHEWARLCAYEPHLAQAQVAKPPPPKLTWTQKRKLAEGKRVKRGRRT